MSFPMEEGDEAGEVMMDGERTDFLQRVEILTEEERTALYRKLLGDHGLYRKLIP